MGKVIVAALPTAHEMERHLQSLVDDEQSGFRNALDLDVSHVDMRAEAYGVRIINVDLHENTISVHYEVDYSIYHGCKDMDNDDSEDRFVSGVRTAKGSEYDEFVPHPGRTTFDEF
jgi:hypothetical protein